MKKLLQFVLMLFILSSCYKKDIQLDDKLESDKVSVIGKKLENPYSLKNMNKAYVNQLFLRYEQLL